MTTLLLSILLFGFFVAALSLRIIFLKDGEFNGTCASQNPYINSQGESCSYCGKIVKPGQECKKN